MTNDKMTETMANAMKDLSELISTYIQENPQAIAASMAAMTRSVYMAVYGPEVTSMIFYKIADEMALYVPKKIV